VIFKKLIQLSTTSFFEKQKFCKPFQELPIIIGIGRFVKPTKLICFFKKSFPLQSGLGDWVSKELFYLNPVRFLEPCG
jgi:hypothetical protein